ncbi:MAG: kinase to dihydroxyacetone kinase [Christensenellales bacterium]|jgi:dihydroxyacetone kinase-like predicted kinase
MLEYRFDVQMLIEGTDLDEDRVAAYITEHFDGDSLLVVGDEELLKVHFHTNEPWDTLKYCASLGDIYDIIIENMQRQADDLEG